MAQKIINKYLWIVDTIQRYGRITLKEFNDLWVKSSLSDGIPMSRRTFYNYRQGIAETFNIEIESDTSSYRYYIANDGTENSSRLVNMLLESISMSDMLKDSQSMGNRILVENVPSARKNLPTMMKALRNLNRITFTYNSYNRANASYGIIIEPYCVRLFKQLWYVIGYNVKDRKIKTYSLDRISDLTINNSETFILPYNFDATTYFNNCFGIMTSQGKPRKVVIKATAKKAKYLRALPLHHTQKEIKHEQHSIFSYKLFLTNDLVSEILSHGPDLQVISPKALRALVIEQLKSALDNY